MPTVSILIGARVVPLGVDSVRFSPAEAAGERESLRRRYKLDHPYVLFVGAMVPRKDVLTLVRAFALALPRLGDAQLVLAGNKTLRWASDWPKVSEWLDRHPDMAGRVQVLDYVAPRDLPALYRSSRVIALTSLLEGFGLTVLEGLACGRPVVATHNSSLVEVGGDAVYYGEVRDPESFAVAIEDAWNGVEWDRRSEQAGAIVAAHTWTRTAELTLDAYRQAA